MNRFRVPWISYVFVTILCFGAVSTKVLPPRISSDTTSYVHALDVISGAPAPENFIPNRLLTTYGGLLSIRSLEEMGFPRFESWLLLNVWFYAVGLTAFYLLLQKLFGGEREALFGVLLLGTSYPAIAFGLNYLMDMGGWALYLVSISFSYIYFARGDRRSAFAAAFVAGVGGLFKEYALLALIPLACSFVWRLREGDRSAFATAVSSAFFFGMPMLVLYTYLYEAYSYTYLDWFTFNQSQYGSSYVSKFKELIKVFGSLLTFLWFLALPGIYLFLRRGRQILGSTQASFIAFLILSVMPLFMWPAITQRIYFLPVMVLLLMVLITLKSYGERSHIFIPLLLLYIAINYAMDAYVLPGVSSDLLLNYFF